LAKLYRQENPILILDEPTTALNEEEVETLFSILNDLKKESSIIFISHRLEEVIKHSSRMIILKDGELVKEIESQNAKISDVENLMVGYGFSDERYHESEQSKIQETVMLEIKDLEIENKFKPISFSLRKGEIIGLIGLVGSGKEDVCKCLFGLSTANSGEIRVNGERASIKSPQDAINAGIGYIPMDRRNDGLALDMNVMDNINLLVLKNLKKGLFLNSRLERENAQQWVKETKIKTSSLRMRAANLSGGNQQKVILSKWLSSNLRILIADHITRGIDIGAKGEIYELLHKLSNAGISIIIMCDTLEEDIGLSHRLILMKDGNYVREVACPKGNKPAPVDIIKLII
jgi:ribose transport system ATP-binding protein